jgi:cytochrome c peroxidase
MKPFPRPVLAVSVLVLVASCVPAGPPKEAAPADPVEVGRRLFNDPSLSGDGRWACATCHPGEAVTDNKTYVGTTVVPDGTPEGRSTPTLRGVKDTAPYSWAGGKTLHDNVKGIIVNRMKGKEPSPEQLDALAAYLGSLEFPRNPNLNPDGSASGAAPAAAKRGWEVFQRASCNICHVPPVFSKADNEDIGSGGAFNVPSLRGLPSTAPYFHDGRFPDLRALLPAKIDYLRKLGSTEKFSDQDLEDLLAYLNTL